MRWVHMIFILVDLVCVSDVTLQVRQRPDSIHGRFRGPVAEALDQYDGILKYISTVAYCSTDLNRNRSFVEYF